ncbi:Cu(I)/Ag(I) efflux system membrane protein CusA/SilA [Fodinibius roseus]|uniref:Cu(I)/Ag(I) efflux system membrane protein CusA/SilA n=1 Tax=Fodinibius roseus TaxID=1194090 RepID=A0A1M4UXV2_9BACT|nr:efflux RND transporter permease subunit [Fodinibius roseus]SHE61498.1 Cu(I)/Ag(I) efflux system membrane protein CusA/SilA [Fodinibius roseus]
MLDKIIRFFLENKLISVLLLLLFVGWGMAVAPFNWQLDEIFPRDPVPVDAIPDLGENQQIVHTEWPGRSPQDIEDQITYPLTTELLGLPGVKSVRSSSMIGLSTIYVIFEEDIEFYWSRSRILEKLNALPSGTLPGDVQPSLGPDATGLGQIFWYTLEGRDENGDPAGGWDPQELRTIQDYTVDYALTSAQGVAEVAPVGGYVREYQVDVDPEAMQVYGITMQQIFEAVRGSNVDVGARTVEMNNVEYLVRGLGYIKSLEDLEKAVVVSRDNTPVRIQDIAHVTYGPAMQRGALDKSGAEAVGGVVVARQGENPLQVIQNVKEQISEISAGLPSKTLEDGTESKVTIVPFYDRTKLIMETLGTLEEALFLQILVTIIVVIVMVMNLRSSVLISGLLPIAVLMTFISMKYGGVDANIVALTGIAIAIGTMVDMAVILTENMIRHIDEAGDEEPLLEVIFRATSEVASAVVTAVSTTVISFLPVFTMVAAEGKLFIPLAYTKTFALIASIIISLIIIPPFAHWFFSVRIKKRPLKIAWNGLVVVLGLISIIFSVLPWAGWLLLLFGANTLASLYGEAYDERQAVRINNVIAAIVVTWLLTKAWLPLGPEVSLFANFIFVGGIAAVLIGIFFLFIRYFRPILQWALYYRKTFLSLPLVLVLLGVTIWLGYGTMFGWMEKGLDSAGVTVGETAAWTAMEETFPGLGEEFMPPLDEGTFLLMPTTMPHVGVEEAKDYMQKIDMAVTSIPEVDMVVGKLGRAETALDPAPISMYENIIQYKSEYKRDEDGRRIRFAVNEEGEYVRNESGELIPDLGGKYYRQWRDHIQSPDDIWNEIVDASRVPGLTSAPKLQPIETRQIMLQSGMRAPMGIKVKGPDLGTIESFGLEMEEVLREVPGVQSQTVFADRIVGKPYLEIEWDREALARYGLKIADVQQYLEVAMGGMALTQTVEGRERYPVRVRYAREYRDSPEEIERMFVATASGTNIPLGMLGEVKYRQGPQVVKSEDTFLTGYVTFDKRDGFSEVEVVEAARKVINEKIDKGELSVPSGLSFEFAGNYENQVRAEKRLSVVMPVTLLIIFLILYFQFRSISTTAMIFSSIFVAWAGGFIMLWLYGQPWFMNFELFGTNMRDLFQMGVVNLSVAVWVGFIALFGIAADGAVVIATYIHQLMDRHKPESVGELHEIIIKAGSLRIRPTLMTTATTTLALLPILTSSGRGADIMIPMAIPTFGGMMVAIVTLFVVPVLYAVWHESKWKIKDKMEQMPLTENTNNGIN